MSVLDVYRAVVDSPIAVQLQTWPSAAIWAYTAYCFYARWLEHRERRWKYVPPRPRKQTTRARNRNHGKHRK